MPCALGRGGIAARKREGDGTTPRGIFPLRGAYFRPDRLPRPRTALPLTPMETDFGWCDDPAHRDYNRLVQLPHPSRHETMWRDDPLYDLLVEIGYNDAPVGRGLGSAIFLHLARADYAPTEGCVAVARNDLIRLVERLHPGDVIEIG